MASSSERAFRLWTTVAWRPDVVSHLIARHPVDLLPSIPVERRNAFVTMYELSRIVHEFPELGGGKNNNLMVLHATKLVQHGDISVLDKHVAGFLDASRRDEGVQFHLWCSARGSDIAQLGFHVSKGITWGADCASLHRLVVEWKYWREKQGGSKADNGWFAHVFRLVHRAQQWTFRKILDWRTQNSQELSMAQLNASLAPWKSKVEEIARHTLVLYVVRRRVRNEFRKSVTLSSRPSCKRRKLSPRKQSPGHRTESEVASSLRSLLLSDEEAVDAIMKPRPMASQRRSMQVDDVLDTLRSNPGIYMIAFEVDPAWSRFVVAPVDVSVLRHKVGYVGDRADGFHKRLREHVRATFGFRVALEWPILFVPCDSALHAQRTEAAFHKRWRNTEHWLYSPFTSGDTETYGFTWDARAEAITSIEHLATLTRGSAEAEQHSREIS